MVDRSSSPGPCSYLWPRAERPTAVSVTRVRAAGRALAAFALGWLSRLGGKRAGVVIVYHRVGGSAGDPRFEILPAVSPRNSTSNCATSGGDTTSSPPRKSSTRRRDDGAEAASLSRSPSTTTFGATSTTHYRPCGAGLTATFFLTGTSLISPHAFWWATCSMRSTPGFSLRMHCRALGNRICAQRSNGSQGRSFGLLRRLRGSTVPAAIVLRHCCARRLELRPNPVSALRTSGRWSREDARSGSTHAATTRCPALGR